MKVPKGKLADARRQMKEKIAEGEIEASPQRGKREWVPGLERPVSKRKVEHAVRSQARYHEDRVKRTRSFGWGDGDLVEIHQVPWRHRQSALKGDIGMILTSSYNGERVTVQVGASIIEFMGTQLRPLPTDDEE
jgi:hypothetical protein